MAKCCRKWYFLIFKLNFEEMKLNGIVFDCARLVVMG